MIKYSPSISELWLFLEKTIMKQCVYGAGGKNLNLAAWVLVEAREWARSPAQRLLEATVCHGASEWLLGGSEAGCFRV